MRILRSFVLIFAIALATAAGASAEAVKVFAAASMKNALDEAAAAWKTEGGQDVSSSYAASSALAKQIEQGAPADLFISADLAWMDYVAEKKLIADDTRRVIAGNDLIAVAPKDNGTKIDIKEGADLAGILGDGKLAVADVKAVPAGKYAKAALEKLGLWASVEKNLAQAENVRAALALVARGEAKLGIVYASDAVDEPNVAVAGIFPQDSHPPIVYPAAVIATSQNPDAKTFLDFLSSPKGVEILKAHGFKPAP